MQNISVSKKKIIRVSCLIIIIIYFIYLFTYIYIENIFRKSNECFQKYYNAISAS